jgi:hypothetical protein
MYSNHLSGSVVRLPRGHVKDLLESFLPFVGTFK